MDALVNRIGRDSPEELQRRVSVLDQAPLVQRILDNLPGMVLVLNEARQAVAANRVLLDLLGVGRSELVGRRPGEIVGCAHWREGVDGCGTAEHCLTCGAVAAILESRRTGQRVTRECRLTLQDEPGGALDLRVTAGLVEVGEERFIVCAIDDISDQKRLAVLMRLFFHDVLNTACGIQGHAAMIADAADEPPSRAHGQRLVALTDELIDEIESQRDLVRAEAGELLVEPRRVHAAGVLEQLQSLHSHHPAAQQREIAVGEVWDGNLITDVRLVRRVLGNMLRNALEAAPAGSCVTLACLLAEDGRVVFSVHNPGTIPADVGRHIFQRSFSTKAPTGRGVGTHSMKLLGERYLRGLVAFTSDESAGTTFTLTLPRVLLASV